MAWIRLGTPPSAQHHGNLPEPVDPHAGACAPCCWSACPGTSSI